MTKIFLTCFARCCPCGVETENGLSGGKHYSPSSTAALLFLVLSSFLRPKLLCSDYGRGHPPSWNRIELGDVLPLAWKEFVELTWADDIFRRVDLSGRHISRCDLCYIAGDIKQRCKGFRLVALV